MRVHNEAYVIAGQTNEEAQRISIMLKSRNQRIPAILHHHSSREGCNMAVKPCEMYNNGEQVYSIAEMGE